eukprot:g21826.t1
MDVVFELQTLDDQKTQVEAGISAGVEVQVLFTPVKPVECRSVQSSLHDVCHVVGSSMAFAALRRDGTCVAWGMPRGGGKTCEALESSVEVRELCATEYAFAALTSDGRVVAWGDPDHGGDCTGGGEELEGVVEVYACEGSFCALLADGRAQSWGACESSAVQESAQSAGQRIAAGRAACGMWWEELNNVQQLCATSAAFAALKADGSVVCWGSSKQGGDLTQVIGDVEHLRATEAAFAALHRDGTVSAWGLSACGGDVSQVQEQGQVEQCPPGFDAPCCSALGWCGRSADHCKCEMCSDYRHKAKVTYAGIKLKRAKRECETIAADLGPFSSPEETAIRCLLSGRKWVFRGKPRMEVDQRVACQPRASLVEQRPDRRSSQWTLQECAQTAVNDSECGKMIMFSFNYPNWGCRCCAIDTPEGDEEKDAWNVYAYEVIVEIL